MTFPVELADLAPGGTPGDPEPDVSGTCGVPAPTVLPDRIRRRRRRLWLGRRRRRYDGDTPVPGAESVPGSEPLLGGGPVSEAPRAVLALLEGAARPIPLPDRPPPSVPAPAPGTSEASTAAVQARDELARYLAEGVRPSAPVPSRPPLAVPRELGEPQQTLPPETLPLQTLPPHTLPPQTLPPHTLPPHTLPPDTLPASAADPPVGFGPGFEQVVAERDGLAREVERLRVELADVRRQLMVFSSLDAIPAQPSPGQRSSHDVLPDGSVLGE